jgi:hypothetical protein
MPAGVLDEKTFGADKFAIGACPQRNRPNRNGDNRLHAGISSDEKKQLSRMTMKPSSMTSRRCHHRAALGAISIFMPYGQQRRGLAQSVKSPLVYAGVALRNWLGTRPSFESTRLHRSLFWCIWCAHRAGRAWRVLKREAS